VKSEIYLASIYDGGLGRMIFEARPLNPLLSLPFLPDEPEQIQTMNSPIVLTDLPDVVELKREFRQLDQREQQLKPTSRAGHISAAAATALAGVRERKAEIARKIFHAESEALATTCSTNK